MATVKDSQHDKFYGGKYLYILINFVSFYIIKYIILTCTWISFPAMFYVLLL